METKIIDVIKDDLLQMRYLEKYGKLIAGLIHNLNTPLMGVQGRLELIKFKMPDMRGLDQALEQLSKINTMLSNMSFLADKDINLDRNETIEISKSIDVIDMLLQSNMEYKHKLEINKNYSIICSVNCISKLFYNSIYEILQNCIEVCGESGKIDINLEKENSDVILSISNNKNPIENNILENLGKPFVTDKENHLGLGIYLAKTNLEKIGMSLSINNFDKGVIYKILIPSEIIFKEEQK